MKTSDLMARLQASLEHEGDLDVILGTLTDDGKHMSFYEEPKAFCCDIPEDDDGKVWKRVMLIGWDEVFRPPPDTDKPKPKLTRVK